MQSATPRLGMDASKPGAGLPCPRLALYCSPSLSYQAPSLPARHHGAAAALEQPRQASPGYPAIHPAYDPISTADGLRCGFARRHYQFIEWSHKVSLWAWARDLQVDGLQVTRHGTV